MKGKKAIIYIGMIFEFLSSYLNYLEGSVSFMRKNKIFLLRSVVMVMLLCMVTEAGCIHAQAKGFVSKNVVAKLVVIDPGCQSVENNKKESVGPGAWSWEAEDLVGAKGVSTETPEYELNLTIAKKTESALKKLGYDVELTRKTNDVDMNNAERSMIANTMNADLYLSIHSSAAGKKDSGIFVLCESADNPYNYGTYSQCRLLADVLRGCLEAKDLDSKDVIETDELIGINWCQVPNAVIRVGNLKNSQDDEKLTDDEYQDKVAEGIAAGIDSYFAQK